MTPGGHYDILTHGSGLALRRLADCVIRPSADHAEVERFIQFQGKFDLVISFLLGRSTVSLDDIVDALGVSRETAQSLRAQVDDVRTGKQNLASFMENMNKEVIESTPLDESRLAAVGDFWTRYRLIIRISELVRSWETRYDRSRLSLDAMWELKRQLDHDFGDTQGVVRAMYENLIPRIERLIQSLES